ncbi:MAG: YhfC family intramembrane metalloprotease [Lachnospiraceae bacterium]|nr:YhfC family intramembrane metalloprotease [Lachnospiraceae bacterium]
MILEQILHAIVLAIMGPDFQSRTVLFGLYAALAAALFEETGRFGCHEILYEEKS